MTYFLYWLTNDLALNVNIWFLKEEKQQITIFKYFFLFVYFINWAFKSSPTWLAHFFCTQVQSQTFKLILNVLQRKVFLVQQNPIHTLFSGIFKLVVSDSFVRKSIITVKLSIVTSRCDNKLFFWHHHSPIICKKNNNNNNKYLGNLWISSSNCVISTYFIALKSWFNIVVLFFQSLMLRF